MFGGSSLFPRAARPRYRTSFTALLIAALVTAPVSAAATDPLDPAGPNAVYADNPPGDVQACPHDPFAIYYNPIRYSDAYYTVSVSETPAPKMDWGSVSSVASAGKALHKLLNYSLTVAPPPSKTDQEKVTTYLNVVAADVASLQKRAQSELDKISDLVNQPVNDSSSLSTLQTAITSDIKTLNSPRPDFTPLPDDSGTKDWTDATWKGGTPSLPLIAYVEAFNQWLTTVVQPEVNKVPNSDPKDAVSDAVTLSGFDGALYQNAYVIDDRFLPLLQNADVSDPSHKSAYFVTTSATGGFQYNGHRYVYHFAAIDNQPLLQNKDTTSSSNSTTNAAPVQPRTDPEPGSDASQTQNSLFTFASRTGGSTGGDQSGAAAVGSKQKTGSTNIEVVTVDCPSVLTKTTGTGFTFLPYRSWQVGSTQSKGTTGYQVQPQNDQYGRFAVPVLFSYRLSGKTTFTDYHLTFGVAATTAAATYLFGLSAMMNRSIMLTGGFAGGTTQTLNGYQTWQSVPKGTAVTTTTSTVFRPMFFVTFPFADTSSDAPKQKGKKNKADHKPSGQTGGNP